MDHLTPLSKGGSHTVSNIVPACRPCNSRKGVKEVLRPVQPLLITVSPALVVADLAAGPREPGEEG